jgi:tetratricopeptide (TPR) repeat protein
VPLLRATQAAFACRFEAAEALAREGLTRGKRAGHQGVDVFYPAVVSNIRWLQGRFAEVEPELRAAAEQWPAIVTFRCALGAALVEAGRDEEARHELERLTAERLATVPRDFTWVSTLALLAYMAAALDDRRAAATVYDLLLPYEPYCVRLSRIGICGLGASAHFLGLLAATMHRWEDAARHLERAVEINLRIGAPACAANSRKQYARALRALGQTERAREEAERADRASSTLGFRLQLARFDRAAPARGEPARGEGLFENEGSYWTIRFRGPTFRLKDSLGVSYIARLLAEPEREVHVLDLSGAEAGGHGGTPVLDARAKAEYRRRMEDLEEVARDAEALGDAHWASRAREEIEALAEQLAHAVGLGGRDRRVGSEVERARVRVTKAIKAGIRRIAEHDGALADHLERSLRTGVFCAYAPDPAARIDRRT